MQIDSMQVNEQVRKLRDDELRKILEKHPEDRLRSET